MTGAILRPSCLKRQKKLYFQQQQQQQQQHHLLLLLLLPPSINHHHLLHNQIQDQYSLSETQQCLFAMQGLQF
jgi:hypothetical protein